MAKNIMKKNDGTRPVFVLDLSNQVAFHTQRHLLGKRTVGELTNMMKSFVSVLRTYHLEVTNEEGGQCLLDAVESFLAGRKNKNVLMEILAAFLLPENFIAVYGTLSSEIKELICAIAVNHYVRAKTAEEIMGRKCLDKWSWFGYGLIDELACFCRANSIYNANTLNDSGIENYIGLSVPDFYGVILKHLYDCSNAPQQVERLPDGLKTFNGEQSALEEVPLLVMLSECGKLKAGRVGTESKTWRKLIAETSMREFFGEDGIDWYMSNLRAFDLLGVYAAIGSQTQLSITPGMPSDMVRLIFQKINTCPSALLIKLLLPQVSGFKSKQFDGCQVNDLIRNICGVLSQLDSEK